MLFQRNDMLFGIKLRTLCLAIGIVHLVSVLVDLCCHILTIGYITSGFQCDADSDDLEAISRLQFLEPVLLILTMGTHGFYPFPQVISPEYNTYIEHVSVSSIARCYPGMLHVYITDVLSLTVNIIWVKFLVGYIQAIKTNDHKSMDMLIKMFIVKLLMQVLYIGYYPPKFEGIMYFQTFCLLKFLDIVIAFYLLMVIRRYAALAQAESQLCQVTEVVEKPPPYVECLIVEQPMDAKCAKDVDRDVEEGKKETETPKLSDFSKIL